MNRIEHAPTPTPTPAQQPQPRFPRSLAVAIAALAVPLVPSPAFGAVTSTGSAPEAPKMQAQTQTRHHLPHGHVLPDPGALTVQAWTTASGWTLTVPSRPAYPGLWDDHPRQVVLPDGTHGEISAYRVSRASPRADNPDAPGTQTPADPVGQDGSTSSVPSGDAPPEWSSGGPSAFRDARSRVVSGPLIPFSSPPTTIQMAAAHRRDADIPDGTVSRPSAPEQVVAPNAVAHTAASACLGAAYPAGNDRYMLAHLRPAPDAMAVVVTPHRTACAARVDYLSQARA
jgi:hypothetical protein